MSIPIGNRKRTSNNLQVTQIASTYNIIMKANDGDDLSISKADFVTALSTAGLGGGASGSGEVIDMGDRMTGDTVVNMGARV